MKLLCGDYVSFENEGDAIFCKKYFKLGFIFFLRENLDVFFSRDCKFNDNLFIINVIFLVGSIINYINLNFWGI